MKDKLEQNDLIYQREIQSLIEERDYIRTQLQTQEIDSSKSFQSVELQTSFDTNWYFSFH